MPARLTQLFLALALGGCATATARSPVPSTATSAAVMAVVDSALRHINSGDLIALSDLMIPEAQVFPAQDRAGRGGTYTVRTVAAQRATGKRAPLIERGYDPIVHVAGTIASVWMPYDLWAEGKWSHCGIDLLTLVQVGPAWRIANFTYTIEQPPACQMHPDGPPPGYAPPPRR
ncbi:hypothetical protein [Gemmatimonas sp.]|uniref:hypothetical protein n=1 Tax=Gemmatimonas sp. TaxID=1962908 RepID=UPI00286D211B|nr:hypothetical protein [Gemmatimonas sp.]